MPYIGINKASRKITSTKKLAARFSWKNGASLLQVLP